MAAPVNLGADIKSGGPGVMFPSNVFGKWTMIHTDAEQANTAAELLNPISVSSAFVIPGIVTQGTRLMIIARIAYAATVTTSPIVRILGADQVPNSSGVFPTGTLFHRIDGDSFTATGLTVTLAAAASAQNDGSTYAWSSVLPATSAMGYQLRGAKAIIVLVSTAANVSTGTVPLYVSIIN
jgi:hypothetical protein